jgi:hypothetical protein
MMHMNKLIRITGIISLVALTGCAYGMKQSLPLDIHTLAITLVNNTKQTGIESDFLNDIKKAFQVDGRLQIVTDSSKADALVEGTIRKYLVENLSYDVNNVASQRRIKMVVDIKVTDQIRKVVLFEKQQVGGIEGGAITFNVSNVGGQTIQPEYLARETVYTNLSQDIVNLVIYGWETY